VLEKENGTGAERRQMQFHQENQSPNDAKVRR
jgi:hypothetical protein